MFPSDAVPFLAIDLCIWLGMATSMRNSLTRTSVYRSSDSTLSQPIGSLPRGVSRWEGIPLSQK